RFPETRDQPPSRVWTGPMAFTPDRMPVVGFLRRRGAEDHAIVIAAGVNGYGGSYCVQVGDLGVQMLKTGKTHEEGPKGVFSPPRLLQKAPLSRGAGSLSQAGHLVQAALEDTSVPADRGLVEVEAHLLGLHVFLDAVEAELAADAALLVASP